MVITKEKLKLEIDDLPEQYNSMIYRVLHALIQMSKSRLANTKATSPTFELSNAVQATSDKSHPILGAFVGAGKTVGNLLEPFEDEWACD